MVNTTSGKQKNVTLASRNKRQRVLAGDAFLMPALSKTDSNCSDVANTLLVRSSKEVLASAENFHKPATASTTTSSSVIPETPIVTNIATLKCLFFSEELLDKLLDKQVLLNKIPDTCPDFTKEDYIAVLEILTCIDQNIITPKQAKLRLLTLATDIESLRGNVIEGIGDLLTIPNQKILAKVKLLNEEQATQPKRLKFDNFNIRYWSWNCRIRLALQSILVKGFKL